MTLTEKDIEKVMEEFRRRLVMDINDGSVPDNEDAIREEIGTRMQGVYGTLMALVTAKNWIDVTWWLNVELDRLEEDLGLTGGAELW